MEKSEDEAFLKHMEIKGWSQSMIENHGGLEKERHFFLAGRSSLADEIAKLRDQRDGLAQVANWFCKRVELGEIRSRRTYAAFREKLAAIESESASPDVGICLDCSGTGNLSSRLGFVSGGCPACDGTGKRTEGK